MPRGQDLSRHQQKIVQRYYDNIDTISLTKLSELVTELYLASDDKARGRLWARVEKALAKVAGQDPRARAVLEGRDIEKLAALVNELSGKKR